MSWTIPAPLVNNGDPVNAHSVNKSTQVLSERTAILKALIDSISSGQNIVMRNVPVDATVLTGHVVYFDDNTSLHKKALANWTSPGANFTAVPADTAVYAGVVIAKPTDQTANILLSGAAALDNAAETRLFNSIPPEAGVYFLSNATTGTVIKDKPAMSVRVLEYLQGGVIRVYPPSHEPITHTHLDYVLLQGDWLPAGSFIDPPVGASHGYDFTSPNAITMNIAEALLSNVGEGTFVGKTDGLHYFEDTIFVDEAGIWWIPGTAPTQDLDFAVISADIKDMSLVHTVLSQTPQALQVSNNNGRVVIDWNAYATEAVAATGKAVVGINFVTHALKLANVVTNILAGAGVTVTSTPTGVFTVASSLYNNLPVLAHTVNLNNAVTSTEGPHAITEFPANRISVMACACAIPNLSDGTYVARIWVQAISPVTSQPAPTVSYSLVPTPAPAGVTPSVPAAIALPAFPGVVSAGDIYYIETANIALVGASKGLLNYTLTLNNPANSLKVVATGIILIQI